MYNIFLGTQEVIIGAVYRPPGAEVAIVDRLNDFMSELRRQHKNVMVADDLNAPGVSWDKSLPEEHEQESAVAILDLCFKHGLIQIVRNYTRIQHGSESVLDLAFLSDSLLSRPYEVDVMPGISDHLIVRLSMTLNPIRRETKTTSTFRDYNVPGDTDILDELDISFEPFEALGYQQAVSVNDMWLRLKEIVHKCITQDVPSKVKTKIIRNPWITREVIQLKRKVKIRRERLRRERSEALIHEIGTLSAQMKNRIKQSKP